MPDGGASVSDCSTAIKNGTMLASAVLPCRLQALVRDIDVRVVEVYSSQLPGLNFVSPEMDVVGWYHFNKVEEVSVKIVSGKFVGTEHAVAVCDVVIEVTTELARQWAELMIDSIREICPKVTTPYVVSHSDSPSKNLALYWFEEILEEIVGRSGADN